MLQCYYLHSVLWVYLYCNQKEEHLFYHHLMDSINTFQKHMHNFSCYKYSNRACRFRKPEIITSENEFIPETGEFKMAKTDGMLNNFNVYLSMLINSNTDIQFIQSGARAHAIIHYICNYIVKSSFCCYNEAAINAAYTRSRAKA